MTPHETITPDLLPVVQAVEFFQVEEDEIVYMDDDELAKEDHIPVSYHNALVLNEARSNNEPMRAFSVMNMIPKYL